VIPYCETTICDVLPRFPGALVVPEEHVDHVVGVLLLAAHQLVVTVTLDEVMPV
jgi:hypothetical protein